MNHFYFKCTISVRIAPPSQDSSFSYTLSWRSRKSERNEEAQGVHGGIQGEGRPGGITRGVNDQPDWAGLRCSSGANRAAGKENTGASQNVTSEYAVSITRY